MNVMLSLSKHDCAITINVMLSLSKHDCAIHDQRPVYVSGLVILRQAQDDNSLYVSDLVILRQAQDDNIPLRE